MLPHLELQKGSSDLSKGEAKRKPRPKGRRIFRLKVLVLLNEQGLEVPEKLSFVENQESTKR